MIYYLLSLYLRCNGRYWESDYLVQNNFDHFKSNTFCVKQSLTFSRCFNCLFMMRL